MLMLMLMLIGYVLTILGANSLNSADWVIQQGNYILTLGNALQVIFV